MAEHLFVYGTLRRISPHPMARLLGQRALFVGQGTVAGQLYNLGRYPGMIQVISQENRVVGDVYLIPDEETTRVLDRYENDESPLPSYFERGLAEVTLADGETVEAMVYWFRGTVVESQRIASGDYGEILEK